NVMLAAAPASPSGMRVPQPGLGVQAEQRGFFAGGPGGGPAAPSPRPVAPAGRGVFGGPAAGRPGWGRGGRAAGGRLESVRPQLRAELDRLAAMPAPDLLYLADLGTRLRAL